MTRRCRAVIAFVLGWTAWLPGAYAEPLALSWHAPPGCPHADVVRARVQRLLDSDGSRSPTARSDVRATVLHAADQFVLSLAIETSSGLVVRELRARDCSLLAESAAVLVALASSQTNTTASPATEQSIPRTGAPTGGAQTTQATVPSPAAVQTTLKRPEPSQSERDRAVEVASSDAARPDVVTREPRSSARVPWAARASLGAGVFANGLPGPRPDLFGEGALEVRALSASVRVGHVFGGSRSLPSNTGAHYFSDYLALTGCGRWGTQRVLAGPCIGVVGSRNHAATEGLVDARNRNALWAQVDFGATLRLRLSARGELGLSSGLLLPITARPQLNVVRVGTLEQGNVVSGYSHIDVGIRFE